MGGMRPVVDRRDLLGHGVKQKERKGWNKDGGLGVILGDGMGVPQQDRLTDRPLIALPVFSSLRWVLYCEWMSSVRACQTFPLLPCISAQRYIYMCVVSVTYTYISSFHLSHRYHTICVCTYIIFFCSHFFSVATKSVCWRKESLVSSSLF